MRELFLVSENSSSYSKDLGNIRLLESLLTELATVEGLNWSRVSYLQPAEMRPSLIDVMTGTLGWCRTSTCRFSTHRNQCCAECVGSAAPTAS